MGRHGAGRQLDKFKQQSHDRIDQRRRKDPLSRTILMGIDIISEKRNVQNQTGHRNCRDLRLIRPQEIEKILYRIGGIKFDEIVDDKAYNGCHQAQDQAQPEVVFFEYHDFHVFSSLLFRT
jgi:hypothetical protein